MAWNFEQKFAGLINHGVPREPMYCSFLDLRIQQDPLLMSTNIPPTPADGFITKYCTEPRE